MRGLVGLVVGMGVLILAGVVTIAVTIVHRMGGSAGLAPAMALDEPAGTAIAGMAPLPDGTVGLVLHGGGPDRVVVVDPKTGRTRRLLSLAR